MLFNTPLFVSALLRAGFHTSAVQNTLATGEPVVSLDYATFQGNSTGGIDSFLGIPYAQPPVGDLRFRRPQGPSSLPGITLATSFGHSCPQQNYSLPALQNINYTSLSMLVSKATPSEDCLYGNVYRPSGVTEQSKLPVVVWFFGGAFSVGDGSPYSGTTVVQRSIQLGEPVILVNFNYRVNAFGWLGGKEVLAAGASNIGLYDQRFFVTWLKKYISQFGGDPNQITYWGQSAGGLSITAHIITNPTVSPFIGAILHSSYVTPNFKTDSQKYQDTYDNLVNYTGCTSAADTLECLRAVPYTTLLAAIDSTPSFLSPNGLDDTWGVTVDGDLMQKTLREYINDGIYAKIPILGGQVDDEGTLFSLDSGSITTDADLKAFLKQHLYVGATDDQINSIANQYPDDPAFGSPFGTGNLSAWTPEFKRLAAIQGDHAFHGGRRFAFSKWAATQNVWSFLWKREKTSLYLGSVHGGELPEMFGVRGDHLGIDAIINFINHQNPNHPSGSTAPSLLSNITWPQYTLDSKNMLLFSDNATEQYTTILDTYRASGIEAIEELQTVLGT